MSGAKTYVGVNGTARKVHKVFVGVSGVARKVKKIYAGVNGVAQLVYTDGWYTANGSISESNVLAAYNFKNAQSDNEALTNIVDNSKYKLDNNSGDRNSTGFLIDIGSNKHLNNNSLQSAGIKSVVLKISSCSASYSMPLCKIADAPGPSVWINTPFCVQSFAYRYSNKFGISHEHGLSVDYVNPPYAIGTLPMNRVRIGGSINSDGVIGFSMDSANNNEALYRNGTEISLSNAKYGSYNWTGFISEGVPRLIGGYFSPGSDNGRWDWVGKHSYSGSFRVQYAAFYKVKLTQAQHNTIATMLNAM